jgi:NADPH:quinone reductase-like Zn-dependent oxidoreductase
MKAAWRDRYGAPDIVEIRDVDRPEPQDDEVLVRVRAASVNRADLDALYARWFFIRLFAGFRTPKVKTLGLDVAGVVEAVGPDATRFQLGDTVFGDMFSYGSAGFAEYVCAPQGAFLPMPVGLSYEEAATLPHSAVLAMQGLRLRDGRTPRAGDKVMIVGASGNVGPFAVQVAKSLGAEVTGVARTDKLDFVRGLGADHVIDYTKTDYTRPAEPYDWIVDVDAHHSFFRWPRALRPGGVYLAMGGPTSWLLQALFVAPLLSRVVGKRLGLLLWWKPFNPDDVAALNDLIAAGKVRPVIDRRYPLTEIVDALRRVDDGNARGKVIVLPDGEPSLAATAGAGQASVR